MTDELTWHSEMAQLSLSGTLTHDTFAPLWQARETITKQIDTINVAALERVDSAGLALLIHLQQDARAHGQVPVFTGISDKLQSLITLYNLEQIITTTA